MVFISPWILWAAFAASIPILIHLVNRWRHKSIQWAAIEFILKVTRERRGKKKLLHYLILALRSLAILVIVAAMARPLLSSFMGWGGSGVQDVVLILDRSASMAARPDHTASLQEMVPPLVSDTIDKLGDTRLILLDSQTRSPLHLASPETLTDLAIAKTTDTTAHIPSLITAAAQYLQESSTGKSEIWIASDMQAGDWQTDSMKWKAALTDLLSLPHTPTIRLLSLKQRPLSNRLIRIDKATVEKNELVLDFTITRQGQINATEETLPVTISIDNAPSVIEIPLSGEKTRLVRRFQLPHEKTEGYGYISIPHDDQPRDDQFFFVFSPEQQVSVLVISPDRDSSLTLERMSAPPGMEGRKSAHAQPGKLPELYSCSFVIWQGPLPQGAQAEKVEQFIENGGIVLFLPDDSAEPGMGEFLGMSWTGLKIAPNDIFYSITNWNHNTGPLRDSANNHALPLGSVHAIKIHSLAGTAETAASWDDGTPALARKIHGKGEALFLTSIPDYKWSNLSEGHMLLPLLQRLADQGNKRLASRTSLVVGDRDVPSSPNEEARRLDNFGANGSPMPASSPAATAGVYSLGSQVFCVNRSELEDDPEQTGEEAVKALLPDVAVSQFSADGSGNLVQEVWKTFLILALLFLLVESALCMPAREKKKKTPL